MNKHEMTFASFLESKGYLYFIQPKKFILPKPYHSYRPDFYVVDNNTFYEVSGTRQAYSYGREKYELFKVEYPDLKLEIVNPDGTRYKASGGRVVNVKPSFGERRYISLPLEKLKLKRNLSENQFKLLDLIIEEGLNMKLFSIKHGIKPLDIHRYLHGKLKYDPEWLCRLPVKFNSIRFKPMSLSDKAKLVGCSVATMCNYYKHKDKLNKKTIDLIKQKLEVNNGRT
jgi:hypothetical protein